MTNIFLFRDPLATQIAESGGKGANLARLTQAGFPVPPGFVLRAQAFRDFISAAPDLFARLAQLPIHNPAALTTEAATLRADLAQLPLPASLESELREALADFPANPPFSVRSSSTLEDLALAAFAGQHETFLNCIGESRILAAIKDCFLSLFSDRAITYRAQRHFPHEQAAMAVVVQQMVPCDSAGVAFTINPVTGDLSELLINSNFGLGESVVSGEAQIDQFALDKYTKALRDQRLGQKTHKIVPVSATATPGCASGVAPSPQAPSTASPSSAGIPPAPSSTASVGAALRRPPDVAAGLQTGQGESSNPEAFSSCSGRTLDPPSQSSACPPLSGGSALTSGVTQILLSPAESSAPSLSPDQLSQIADLALRVEAHYQFPQDIEWGFASNQLSLLQSRPISTIPPRWTRDESAERFPTAITPLTWDFVEDGFHRSLTFSLRLMGFPPFQGKWFAMFDHYIYGNQNAVDLYLKRIPLRLESLAQLEAAIPHVRENYRWVQEIPLLWSRDLDHYLIRIGEFMAYPIESEPIPILWNYVKEVRELGAHYFQPNIAISITQSLLHRVLYHLLVLTVGPTDAPRLHDSLLAFCETKTGMINAELYSLAAEVHCTPALLQLFRDHSSRDLIEQKHLPPFREFSAHFDTFLRVHGHREVEFDAYHPTWIEIPWIVLDHIRLLLAALDPSFSSAPPKDRPAPQSESDASSISHAATFSPDPFDDHLEGARLVPSDSVGTPLRRLADVAAGLQTGQGESAGPSRPDPRAAAPRGTATPGCAPCPSRLPQIAFVSSPSQREHELRLRMHKAEIELFQRLSPALHFFFHEIIRLARAYTSLDDLEHYQTTRLTLPLRRSLRELGRRLYVRSVIGDPMDIFFARAADLEKAVLANDDKRWRALGESIRAEKEAYLRDRQRTPAWTLDPTTASSAAILPAPSSTAPVGAALRRPLDAAAGLQTGSPATRANSVACPPPSGESPSDLSAPTPPGSAPAEALPSESFSSSTSSISSTSSLSGLPGSPGQATGPVFLVRSIDDFAAFPKGAVLVARTTNPTWTPLFYNAVAVVTESGGPLSHGAVTAREMQIPAVMSVRDCLSALKNGDTVRVDGSRGLVTLFPP